MRVSRPLLVGLALGVVTIAVWWPLLGNEFVNYDDDLYVTNNAQVREGLTSEGVAWAFSSFHGANWFPLTRLSWMLDAELFGLEPRAFHATSLGLHIGAALLLFAALLRMTGALWASAFVAAVFAWHPLHVESVAWAAARKDVLSGLFAMATILAYAGWTRRGGAARYTAVLACLALGLMAKQTLVALPLVLLLLDVWPLDRLRRIGWRRALGEKLALLAVVLASIGVAYTAQRSWGTVQSFELFPPGLRVANAIVSCAAYLGQTFWPRGLAVFYPHPAGTLAAGDVAAAAVLLAAVTALAVRERRRRPALAVGWLWFLLTLAPVLGLVQIGQAARADRYMYLPLLGPALALGWELRALAARGRAARALVAAAAGLALAALALGTSAQLRVWRDSISLFEHALAVTEHNHVAHLNLGLALTNAGRLDEASRHLDAAVRLAPGSEMARGVLGELRLRQERWAEAAELFEAALRGRRDKARWHAGLAAALERQGDLDAAADHFRSALRGRPRAAHLHANLGFVRTRQGRHAEAIAAYREALRWDPDLEGVRAPLAASLAASGDRDAALAELDAALERRPASAELQLARAQLLERAGRSDEAVSAYRAALEGGARDPLLLNNLAWILATGRQRDPAEAVELAEQAARLTAHRDAAILDTLAVAYAAAGRAADAARVRARIEALAREP